MHKAPFDLQLWHCRCRLSSDYGKLRTAKTKVEITLTLCTGEKTAATITAVAIVVVATPPAAPAAAAAAAEAVAGPQAGCELLLLLPAVLHPEHCCGLLRCRHSS